MKVIVISLCFFHVAFAQLLLNKLNVNQNNLPEINRPESVCRVTAYANAVGCTLNGFNNETYSKELECMAEVVGHYLNCTDTDLLPQETRRTMSSGLSTRNAGGITLSQIKCIVDNILDLIKCVVDGQLVDTVPYKWNWPSFMKCMVSNIPSYIVCFKPVL